MLGDVEMVTVVPRLALKASAFNEQQLSQLQLSWFQQHSSAALGDVEAVICA